MSCYYITPGVGRGDGVELLLLLLAKKKTDTVSHLLWRTADGLDDHGNFLLSGT